MCKVLQVSSSSYDYWLKHPVSLTALKSQELLMHIDKTYQKSRCRYGSPGITMKLRASGIRVPRPRVARVMRRANMKSTVRQKYHIQSTDSRHIYTVSENYPGQDFTAGRLAQKKWVSDLTCIKMGEGWLYLTTIIDLADRKVISWVPSESMRTGETTVAAFRVPVNNRPVVLPLLFHSDRGIQYACHEFTHEMKKWPIQQSMSRKGNCWDNAVAERFFKTLKTEMVYHSAFKTKAQAKLAVFEYIEVRYNRQRRHPRTWLSDTRPTRRTFIKQQIVCLTNSLR